MQRVDFTLRLIKLSNFNHVGRKQNFVARFFFYFLSLQSSNNENRYFLSIIRVSYTTYNKRCDAIEILNVIVRCVYTLQLCFAIGEIKIFWNFRYSEEIFFRFERKPFTPLPRWLNVFVYFELTQVFMILQNHAALHEKQKHKWRVHDINEERARVVVQRTSLVTV